MELTRIEGTKHGLTIASQMMDVAVRVQAVRAFSVSQMVSRHLASLQCLECLTGVFSVPYRSCVVRGLEVAANDVVGAGMSRCRTS